MKKIFSCTLVTCALLALNACAKPEGPAERMGRSIDEMSGSFKDLSKEWNEQTGSTRSGETAPPGDAATTRKAEPYPGYRDDREIPDHDPYYDTPPATPSYDRESRTYKPEHY